MLQKFIKTLPFFQIAFKFALKGIGIITSHFW